MFICAKSEGQFNKEKAKAVNVKMPSVLLKQMWSSLVLFLQKKTNLANTQPFWPHAWSVTLSIRLRRERTYFIPRFPTDILCCIFQLIKWHVASEIEISNDSIVARECLKSRIQNLTKHVQWLNLYTDPTLNKWTTSKENQNFVASVSSISVPSSGRHSL